MRHDAYRFRGYRESMTDQDIREMEEVELSNTQLNRLVHYFGIDSADTSESLVEGIDALIKLQRS